MNPLYSVVIPVYNGAETLPACLKALQRQTVPPETYEVIVVDDGSTDGSADVARKFDVRLISQSNAGPAAARNRGAEEARGEILLFTDADCIPCSDWIEQMTMPFTHAEVTGAKGTYRTRQRGWIPRFVQLEYEDRYDRMRNQPSIDFVDTYSAAYRRDIFLRAGGFDPAFPTASVEDQELSFRLAEQGYHLVFVPEAHVFHTHNNTLWAYVRRKFWIGYWKVRVMHKHPDKLVRDSHTPQVLKLQIGLAALGALLIGGKGLNKKLGYLGWASWGGLVISGLPFLLKILQRDPAIFLIAPLMLFIRAWTLGLGFLVGSAKWSFNRLH
ncbi:MAG: glycosyltransferase [Anaerolineae bacterium]